MPWNNTYLWNSLRIIMSLVTKTAERRTPILICASARPKTTNWTLWRVVSLRLEMGMISYNCRKITGRGRSDLVCSEVGWQQVWLETTEDVAN